MSDAIHYVTKDSTEQSPIDESSRVLLSIPEQAISVPIGAILNKETLLTSLAKACDFPSWFGHNWDAAWDCLTDSDIEHLILDLTATYDINNEDFHLFKSLIEDAFRDFGKPQLWIMMAANDSLSRP